MGGAVVQAGARHRDPQASRGEPHQHGRAHLRPRVRRAQRPRLPRRRPVTDRGCAPAPDLHRHGPRRGGGDPRRRLRRAWRPPSWRRCCRRWCSRPGAPTTPRRPELPGGRVQPALGELVRLWGQLDALERDHKLDFLREPDLGFAWAAWRWAEGDDLDDVLMVTGLSAGDFVRWMKQLLDLCGQVADAAGDTPLRSTARKHGSGPQAGRGRLLGAGRVALWQAHRRDRLRRPPPAARHRVPLLPRLLRRARTRCGRPTARRSTRCAA